MKNPVATQDSRKMEHMTQAQTSRFWPSPYRFANAELQNGPILYGCTESTDYS